MHRGASSVQMRPNLGKILHCEAQAVYISPWPLAAAAAAATAAALVAVKKIPLWNLNFPALFNQQKCKQTQSLNIISIWSVFECQIVNVMK